MKFSALLTAICLATCSFEAQGVKAASATQSDQIVWMTDFEQAKALAKAESKPLFVDFSGSDWCPHCKNLDKEILKTAEFEQALGQKMIFVVIDFPRYRELDPKVKKQNEELAKAYQVRGFPTVLIFDSDMNKIGSLGYMSGGPQPFIKKVEAIIAK